MRRKSRIIQGPLRRSPRKFSASTSTSTSRALPILLSQSDKDNGKSNEPQETVFETYSDSGEDGDDVAIGVTVAETETNSRPIVVENGVDLGSSLGLGICTKCDIEDELVLVCGEIGCSIAVHRRCMGCDPSFDESGKFRCPICKQKRALARVEEARRKVMEAKRALMGFLNGGFGDNVGSDRLKGLDGGDRREMIGNVVDGNGLVKGSACLRDTRGVETVEEEGKGDLGLDDEDVGIVRDTGLGSNEGMELEASGSNDASENEGSSEMCEKNESVGKGEDELEAEESDELGNAKEMCEAKKTVVKCSKRFKQTAGKMVNLRNKIMPHRTSSRMKAAILRKKAVAKKSPLNSYKTESFPHPKRKRLHWTSEEEQILWEGVQEITRGGSKNVSWKSILGFGRQVFNPTRTPDDLKDKWRNMMAKKN